MSEKKFAALSSSLLARKGAAKPAMRRERYINPQGEVAEDLGWNDMGSEGPEPVNSEIEFNGDAPVPEVCRQQDQLNQGFEDDQNLNGAIPEDGGFKPEREPYKASGHGGLTPMGQEDQGDKDDADARYEVDAEAEIEAESKSVNGVEAEADADEVNGSAHGLSIYRRAPFNGETPGAEPRKNMQAVREPQSKVSRSANKIPARKKVAFTLRLDTDRHLKLRLASAITNQSAQRLVTEALDRFLEEHPDVQALSDHSGSKTH